MRAIFFLITVIVFLGLPDGAISDSGVSILVGYAGFLIAGAFLAASIIVATTLPTSFSVLRIDQILAELQALMRSVKAILWLSIWAVIALFVSSFDLPSIPMLAGFLFDRSSWAFAQATEFPDILAQSISLSLLLFATDRVRVVFDTLSAALRISGLIARDYASSSTNKRAPSPKDIGRIFPTPKNFAKRSEEETDA